MRLQSFLTAVATCSAYIFAALTLLHTTFAVDPRDVDKILVEKAARTLTLLHQQKVVKTYRIALGSNSIGPKQAEGDERTPEGFYKVDWRNPKSKYHLSLHISYPNETDVKNAKMMGVSPGGEIMIHGLPNGMGALGAAHRLKDWTLGCIAVTNEEIEEIWALVKDGTVVEIRP